MNNDDDDIHSGYAQTPYEPPKLLEHALHPTAIITELA